MEASCKLKSGKGPGLDGIPTEAVKKLVGAMPEVPLAILNWMLHKQIFPMEWKSSNPRINTQVGENTRRYQRVQTVMSR